MYFNFGDYTMFSLITLIRVNKQNEKRKQNQN